MFHILVARFILEANENIPKKCNLNDVSCTSGRAALRICSWGTCLTVLT